MLQIVHTIAEIGRMKRKDKGQELLPPKGVLRRILQEAARAPSADNNQPWLFSTVEGRLVAQLDRSRCIKSDPERIMDTASLGMALENLRVSALEHGYLSHFVPTETNQTPDEFRVEVVFEKGGEKSELYHSLALRGTNRLNYDTRPLPKSVMDEVHAACSQYTAKVSAAEDKGAIADIARGISACDVIRLKYRTFHEELYGAIRWSKTDAARSGDGLLIDSLALPFPGKHLLKPLENWKLCSLLMKLGAGALMAASSKAQVESSSALFMISAQDGSQDALLEAGMLAERLWLILTARGISAHPLASFPVFNDLALDSRSTLHRRDRTTVLKARDKILRAFHSSDCEVPVLIFRAGYAPCRSARNHLRRSISDMAPELFSKKEESFDYSSAFSRNIGIVSKVEQEHLRNSRIAIPGLGGVGGYHLATLARMGVGRFHAADFDAFDIPNFNRQFGAFASTVGEKKTDVMSRIACDINPEVDLKIWNEAVTEENVDEFLRGCQLVVDSLDAFAIEARRLVFRRARALGIPAVTAGPIGLSCCMLIFTPESISFDEYFAFEEGMSEKEQFARFVVGLLPHLKPFRYLLPEEISCEEKRGPSFGSAVTLCAGFAAVEALKLLLGRQRVKTAPYYHYYDPFLMEFKCRKLRFGNRSVIQQVKYKAVKKMISS